MKENGANFAAQHSLEIHAKFLENNTFPLLKLSIADRKRKYCCIWIPRPA
jgi:hypothetical protein